MLTVGEILKKERQNKGMTLDDVEKHLRVRIKYLRAIETNDWNFFTSKIYVEGLLKNYAKLLGIDHKKIQAFFRRDYEKKEDLKFNKNVDQGYLTPETRKLLRFGFSLIIVIFLGYFIYQLNIYFAPPKLSIITPKTDTFTVEKRIEIVAKTDKDTLVYVTGERVFQNDEGIFKYQIPLNEGLNRVVFELTGANGKKTRLEKVFTKKTPK